MMIPWKPLMVIVAAILCWTAEAPADTLYLQSGASVPGQILSFDGQRYRVQVEGEMFTYNASEVRGFTIERAAQKDDASLQPVLQKLDEISYKLDAFRGDYQQKTSDMQQKIFDLNPVSQLVIRDQETRIDPDGNLLVRGRLTNTSNEVIRNFRLRATLFDTAGNEARTVEHQLLANVLGPGEQKSFKITIPNPPPNPGQVRIVPYVWNRPSEEDVGDYQQVNPAVRYYRR